MSKKNKYDCLIIGAGPAGLALSLSLAKFGLRVAIIDKQPEEGLKAPLFDGRDIALTHRSREILTTLNVWDHIPNKDIFPLKEAKVINGDSPYTLNFEHTRTNKEALGYLISNHLIRQYLYAEVEHQRHIHLVANAQVTHASTNSTEASITLSNGEVLRAPLLIGADSRFSEARRQFGIPASMDDLGHTVVVCRMKHEKHHRNIAYECFHYGRTLAVLPLSENQSSVVITAPTEQAARILTMDEKEFSKDIQTRFENRLGKMTLVSQQFSYPLVTVYARRFVATRFALIGDAAVGMHPVTAQGFNLGLQGQDILATQIKRAQSCGIDIGSSSVLTPYQSKHQRNSKPLYLGTNAIVKMFTNDQPLHRFARKALLRIANNSRLFKMGTVSYLVNRV